MDYMRKEANGQLAFTQSTDYQLFEDSILPLWFS